MFLSRAFNLFREITDSTFNVVIYASVKVLPNSILAKMMPILDSLMPKKKYYCEKVSDSFYRGSDVGLKEIKALAEKGIKKIVNLKVQTEREFRKITKMCQRYGISYINIPMNVFEKPDDTMEKLKNVVENATSDEPVYVHCKYGEDRTGFATGLHLLLNEKWPIDEIVQDMEEKGYKKELFPQLANTLKELAAGI